MKSKSVEQSFTSANNLSGRADGCGSKDGEETSTSFFSSASGSTSPHSCTRTDKTKMEISPKKHLLKDLFSFSSEVSNCGKEELAKAGLAVQCDKENVPFEIISSGSAQTERIPACAKSEVRKPLAELPCPKASSPIVIRDPSRSPESSPRAKEELSYPPPLSTKNPSYSSASPKPPLVPRRPDSPPPVRVQTFTNISRGGSVARCDDPQPQYLPGNCAFSGSARVANYVPLGDAYSENNTSTRTSGSATNNSAGSTAQGSKKSTSDNTSKRPSGMIDSTFSLEETEGCPVAASLEGKNKMGLCVEEREPSAPRCEIDEDTRSPPPERSPYEVRRECFPDGRSPSAIETIVDPAASPVNTPLLSRKIQSSLGFSTGSPLGARGSKIPAIPPPQRRNSWAGSRSRCSSHQVGVVYEVGELPLKFEEPAEIEVPPPPRAPALRHAEDLSLIAERLAEHYSQVTYDAIVATQESALEFTSILMEQFNESRTILETEINRLQNENMILKDILGRSFNVSSMSVKQNSNSRYDPNASTINVSNSTFALNATNLALPSGSDTFNGILSPLSSAAVSPKHRDTPPRVRERSTRRAVSADHGRRQAAGVPHRGNTQQSGLPLGVFFDPAGSKNSNLNSFYGGAEGIRLENGEPPNEPGRFSVDTCASPQEEETPSGNSRKTVSDRAFGTSHSDLTNTTSTSTNGSLGALSCTKAFCAIASERGRNADVPPEYGSFAALSALAGRTLQITSGSASQRSSGDSVFRNALCMSRDESSSNIYDVVSVSTARDERWSVSQSTTWWRAQSNNGRGTFPDGSVVGYRQSGGGISSVSAVSAQTIMAHESSDPAARAAAARFGRRVRSDTILTPCSTEMETDPHVRRPSPAPANSLGRSGGRMFAVDCPRCGCHQNVRLSPSNALASSRLLSESDNSVFLLGPRDRDSRSNGSLGSGALLHLDSGKLSGRDTSGFDGVQSKRLSSPDFLIETQRCNRLDSGMDNSLSEMLKCFQNCVKDGDNQARSRTLRRTTSDIRSTSDESGRPSVATLDGNPSLVNTQCSQLRESTRNDIIAEEILQEKDTDEQ